MKTKISKLFLAILAVVMLPPALANAQEKEGFRLIQPEIVEFNPYWYMQLQAGGGYTVGETNDFFKLTTPAAAINFGYRAVPWFGFRFGASGWQGKGYMVSPELNYKWNYVQGNIDAIVSLTNAFCGFNPDRVIDAYIGVGIGGAYGWHNKQAIDYNDKYGEMQKLWKKRRAFLAGRGILGIDFNTSSVFAINVELNANMMPDSWNSKRGANVDWQFNGLVGFTLKFGSNKKVTPAVYEEIVEGNRCRDRACSAARSRTRSSPREESGTHEARHILPHQLPQDPPGGDGESQSAYRLHEEERQLQSDHHRICRQRDRH